MFLDNTLDTTHSTNPADPPRTADEIDRARPTQSPVSRSLNRLPAILFLSFFVTAAVLAIVFATAFRTPTASPGGSFGGPHLSGYFWATGSAFIAAILSAVLLTRVNGRPIESAVTMTIAASGVRMLISVVGLIVAVGLYKTPPVATGLAVCVYYLTTLVTETVVLKQSIGRPGDDLCTQADRKDS